MTDRLATSDTENGSSPLKHLDDTDRQILEWAGKLEMESIDLREKAGDLLSELRKRCNELNVTQKGIVDWKNTMNDELTSFKEEVLRALQDKHKVLLGEIRKTQNSGGSGSRSKSTVQLPPLSAGEMDKFSSRIIKSFETRQNRWLKEFQSTQQVLYNVTVQMDRVTEVLGNMSRDLQNLTERQVTLEQELVNQRYEHNQHNLSTPPPSFVASRKRSASPTPRGVTLSKTRDKVNKTRYIIPWEDISDQEL
ncbi:HBL233Wp [Eremothecium sinecaudum]|uniref:HBL233Wp n=1 Tax=Eremothecium sinecaudum TaxID=45286 RepID=A0A109UW90_9SACH|nr:HBL233Wp [Eremothecium sinecaudum]AMD18669.1 HBL233Wp [Eremothecium sinecaudum]